MGRFPTHPPLGRQVVGPDAHMSRSTQVSTEGASSRVCDRTQHLAPPPIGSLTSRTLCLASLWGPARRSKARSPGVRRRPRPRKGGRAKEQERNSQNGPGTKACMRQTLTQRTGARAARAQVRHGQPGGGQLGSFRLGPAGVRHGTGTRGGRVKRLKMTSTGASTLRRVAGLTLRKKSA